VSRPTQATVSAAAVAARWTAVAAVAAAVSRVCDLS